VPNFRRLIAELELRLDEHAEVLGNTLEETDVGHSRRPEMAARKRAKK
jgi:hypothetical protein